MKAKTNSKSERLLNSRAVQDLHEKFIRDVLKMEFVHLTELVKLSHLRLFPPEEAIGKGKKLGRLIFERSVYKGRKDKRNYSNDKNWTREKIEDVPDITIKAIVGRVKKLFGVDITPLVNSTLLEIYTYILQSPSVSKFGNFKLRLTEINKTAEDHQEFLIRCGCCEETITIHCWNDYGKGSKSNMIEINGVIANVYEWQKAIEKILNKKSKSS